MQMKEERGVLHVESVSKYKRKSVQAAGKTGNERITERFLILLHWLDSESFINIIYRRLRVGFQSGFSFGALASSLVSRNIHIKVFCDAD